MSEVVHLDGRIGRVATAQGGVVSREQALALGASRRAIDVRIRSGRLVSLHRGVYAVGHIALTARGKAIGALLAVPGGILSHRTAGVVWVIIEDDLAMPDICTEAELAHAVREARIRHHLQPQHLLSLIDRSPGSPRGGEPQAHPRRPGRGAHALRHGASVPPPSSAATCVTSYGANSA